MKITIRPGDEVTVGVLHPQTISILALREPLAHAQTPPKEDNASTGQETALVNLRNDYEELKAVVEMHRLRESKRLSAHDLRDDVIEALRERLWQQAETIAKYQEDPENSWVEHCVAEILSKYRYSWTELEEIIRKHMPKDL